MLTKKYHIKDVWGLPVYVSQLWILIFILFSVAFSQEPTVGEYIRLTDSLAPYEIRIPAVIPSELTFRVSNVTYGFAVVSSLYLSVVAHEFGHVYGAIRNDASVNGVTLWVLGGAAELTDEPTTAKSEFEVTILGPCVSGILMILTFVGAIITAPLNIMSVTSYFHILFVLNGAILTLNLIPAFPLDGGRLLRSILSLWMTRFRSTRYATRVAQVVSLVVIAVSIFTINLMGVVLAGFIYIVSAQERTRVKNKYQHESQTEKVSISEQDFVFETTPSDFTTPFPIQLIRRSGGTVSQSLNDSTDYLVVADDTAHKYETLAHNYDADVVSASKLDNTLQELLRRELKSS